MIENLIKKVANKLDEYNIAYMLIGGQAVLVYGRPRLTQDIDIILGVDTDKFSIIESICKELGLGILPENPSDFAVETKVLPVEEPKSKIRIDFIFSFSSYESLAIKRATNIVIDDYPVKFASCEDVIIHKMVAGRAIDHEDVKSILVKNKSSIDFNYIHDWLVQFDSIVEIVEYEGISHKFDILKEKYAK